MALRNKLIGTIATLAVLALLAAGAIWAAAKPYQRDRIAILLEQTF